MPQFPRPRLFRAGESDKDRAEAFSDGVLAIVMTLLFFEVKPPASLGRPEAEVWADLAHGLGSLAAAVISFVFILYFWIAHHYLFQQMQKIDRGVLWLNGLFLLSICLIPYPTAMEGAAPGSSPATVLLGAAMFLSAAIFSLLRAYASYHAGLFGPDHERKAIHAAMIRSLVAPFIYGAAAVMGFWMPVAALVLIAAVPVIYLLPSRLERISQG